MKNIQKNPYKEIPLTIVLFIKYFILASKEIFDKLKAAIPTVIKDKISNNIKFKKISTTLFINKETITPLNNKNKKTG